MNGIFAMNGRALWNDLVKMIYTEKLVKETGGRLFRLFGRMRAYRAVVGGYTYITRDIG